MKKQNKLRQKFTDAPLRTKLMIAFAGMAIISLGLLSGLYYYTTRTSLINEANRSLYAAVSETALRLDNFIESNLTIIETEASLPDFVDLLLPLSIIPPTVENMPDSIQQYGVLSSLRRRDLSNIISCGILAKNGINVADTNVYSVGGDESSQAYFLKPLESNESYVSPVIFTADSSVPSIYFSTPIRSVNGKVLGVLRLRYKASILQNLVEEVSSLELTGQGSLAVLYDDNQLQLAHGDADIASNANYKFLEPIGNPALIKSLQLEGRLPDLPVEDLTSNHADLAQKLSDATDNHQNFFVSKEIAVNGEENQVAVKMMTTQPWAVAYVQPKEVILASADKQFRNTFIIAVFVLVAAVMLATWASMTLIAPITRLTEVAQRVASGDLEAQVPIQSRDEVGKLAVVFNGMTTQLRHLIGSLEEQVQGRTKELFLSIEVGQKAASIRQLDILLPTIVELIRERFDLYYTHVYFVDDTGKTLVIKAGTGSVGQTLLAQKHRITVGSNSIVGQVAVLGNSIVVSDTKASDIHQINPLLPKTRSELAVPLIVEGEIIGVLDMQAEKALTFTENDVPVFEAMATQFASAIDSAQQWALSQEAQQKAAQAIKQLTRESWGQKLETKTAGGIGFTYDLTTISPIETQPQALSADAGDELSAPLVVQNQIIGRLSVKPPGGKSVTKEQQVLLESIAQQLAQKAENLRLFEDTQKRAVRERLTRQIIDKMRASSDVDTIIQTGLVELANALDVSRSYIKFSDLLETQDKPQTE